MGRLKKIWSYLIFVELVYAYGGQSVITMYACRPYSVGEDKRGRGGRDFCNAKPWCCGYMHYEPDTNHNHMPTTHCKKKKEKWKKKMQTDFALTLMAMLCRQTLPSP